MMGGGALASARSGGAGEMSRMPRSKQDLRILGRLLGMTFANRRLAIGTIATLLVSMALELAVPRLIQGAIDGTIEQREVSIAIVLGVVIVGITAFKGVFTFLTTYLGEVLSQQTTFQLRGLLFERIQSLSFSFHDKARTGELMSRTTSDVDRVRFLAGMGLMNSIRITLMIVGVVSILTITNWSLALLSLASLPILIYVALVFSQRIRPLFVRVQQCWGAVNTVLQENLTGVKVVRAFAREDDEIAKFEPFNEELTGSSIQVVRMFALRQPLFEAVAAMGVAAVLWYGGLQVIDGHLTIGELVAFNTYLLLLRMPIQMLGFTVSIFARATASGDRIFEILDRESDVRERPDAVSGGRINGGIDFENVGFAYEGDDVLQGVSFTVAPGQILGIVGGTGSGKSTIINLLPRFYDVTGGRILVDGIDIRDFQIAPLRAAIGIVSQETFLFGANLRENISYGRPDAGDAEIMQAADAAQLGEFIRSLPEGLETKIGERGTTLSGGQKQRVAIARALLLDPRILILDESTSSVDTETERALQEALAELMKGRTTLIISQRIASVVGAEEIVVLESGRIVQRGGHVELQRQSGLYRDMFDMQVDSESAAVAESSAGAGR